jgi:hypothetical protein
MVRAAANRGKADHTRRAHGSIFAMQFNAN